MKLNLPKNYLSSSACDTWEKNPQAYREKYYLNQPGFSTPYTKFGKEFADDIERNPGKYPKVPKGNVGEFPVKWVVAGVPVLGYLDSFETTTKSIFEYKTSIVSGTNKWDNVKVRKWKQLPFYAMCIRDMFGDYNQLVKLVVLQTEWAEICKETKFGTKLIRECEKALQFAPGAVDNPDIYERVIEPWELDLMTERLVTIAQDISKDFTSYQQSVIESGNF